MRRVLKAVVALFVYVCVGTVLAQALLVGYLWSEGHLDREKMVDVLVAMHQIELAEEPSVDELATDNEQVALDAILRQRAILARNLEFKQQYIDKHKDELSRISRRLTEKNGDLTRLHDSFLTKLAAIDEGARAEARAEVTLIVQNAKPKQAKSQLMLMWDAGEIRRVVTLLTSMPEANRKKIIAEFKSEEDNEILAEILREIGRGGPKVNLTDSTREQLGLNGQPNRR